MTTLEAWNQTWRARLGPLPIHMLEEWARREIEFGFEWLGDPPTNAILFQIYENEPHDINLERVHFLVVERLRDVAMDREKYRKKHNPLETEFFKDHPCTKP